MTNKIANFRCSAAQKCCWTNNCNRSCILAEDLNRISTFTLPPIPTDVTIISMEYETKRNAKISWLMRIPHNRYDEQIDYVVEARAHIGYTFSIQKLGQSFALNTSNFHHESIHSYKSKWVSVVVSTIVLTVNIEMMYFILKLYVGFAHNLGFHAWCHCKLDDFMNFVYWLSTETVPEVIPNQQHFNWMKASFCNAFFFFFHLIKLNITMIFIILLHIFFFHFINELNKSYFIWHRAKTHIIANQFNHWFNSKINGK